jgi:hypothetical protein
MATADEAEADGIAFFENRIRPLLVERCYECHGEEQQESELRLDSFAAIMRGGASGMAVVPGQPDESLLLVAVGYLDDDLQMPPDASLPKQQVDDLRHWVELGAPHPDAEGTPSPVRSRIDTQGARTFWAFQTPVKPPLPVVLQHDWPQSPIDFFVLKQLELTGLSPSPRADKRIRLRRVTYDLTGLPPTPAEISSFLTDETPNAWARVVDRLINSPRYGERWARHWLDVARYADSNGLDENIAHGNAWRYRDYIIASFNLDKPYDQFLCEQLAGDLMPFESAVDRHDKLIATGFLTLGPKVLAEGDEQKMEMDIIDEQISTLGQSVLGLTIGCARCHDHKFDPISHEDYYALASIFKSTRTMESFKRIARWNENVIATPEQQAIKSAHDEKVAALQAKVTDLEQRNKDGEQSGETEPQSDGDGPRAGTAGPTGSLAALKEELKQLADAAPQLPTAMGVVDGEVTDLRIHVRGSHLHQGKQVRRGVPTVLAFDGQPAMPAAGSGRLALAHWLIRPEHPLTARVFVNRVWRWYFERGLVATVDNFGQLGNRPDNAELLDWLAVDFAAHGWSMKRLHRQILLSSTYQMSSQANDRAAAVDPENRKRWRAGVRRLQAEEIRDALLMVGGQLDDSMGGSMLHVENRAFIFDHTSKDETSYDRQRRSIYMPVIRNHLYDVFSLFDYSDASVANGNRPTSMIAPQALFMMNSQLFDQASQQLATVILQNPTDDDARVVDLYERTLARSPDDDEHDRASKYLAAFRHELESQQVKHIELEAWAGLCHVLLASSEFLYLR